MDFKSEDEFDVIGTAMQSDPLIVIDTRRFIFDFRLNSYTENP